MIGSVDDRMQHRFLVVLLGLLCPLLLSPHSVSARAESSIWRGSQASTSRDAGQHALLAHTAAAALPLEVPGLGQEHQIMAQSAKTSSAFPTSVPYAYGSVRHIKPDPSLQLTGSESDGAAWADVAAAAGQTDGAKPDQLSGG